MQQPEQPGPRPPAAAPWPALPVHHGEQLPPLAAFQPAPDGQGQPQPVKLPPAQAQQGADAAPPAPAPAPFAAQAPAGGRSSLGTDLSQLTQRVQAMQLEAQGINRLPAAKQQELAEKAKQLIQLLNPAAAAKARDSLDSEDGNACSVCFESLKSELMSAPCGHVFHELCIVQCLHKRAECPRCRAPCAHAGLKRLFF